MRNCRILGALLVGAMLAGCGSQIAEHAELASMPLRSSDARLKIYRTDTLESAGDPARIRVDGREVASLGIGGSTMLDVPAGPHKIVVDDPWHPNSYEISLTAKAGAHYEFEVLPRSE